ncbi:MAG TPA: sigma 54-interacting transcriptional regulator [Pyrinomonadaceae bacterium]
MKQIPHVKEATARDAREDDPRLPDAGEQLLLCSTMQSQGTQAESMEVIKEAINNYEQEGQLLKAAGRRSDLAYCLWERGDFKEAYATIYQALKEMGDGRAAPELKLHAVIRAAVFEEHAGRLDEAEELLGGCDELVKDCGSHVLRAKFHHNRASLYSKLAEHGRKDYADRALIEYEAALFHFNEAGAEWRFAHTLNNLGFFLRSLGKYDESARHLSEALKRSTQLGDPKLIAGVTDSRARLSLDLNLDKDAVNLARESVRLQEGVENRAGLAESLTTLGVALARTGLRSEARRTLARAIKEAREAGAREKAGLAALAAIEELGDALDIVTAREYSFIIHSCLEQAALPGRTQARVTNAVLKVLNAPHAWNTFTSEPATHEAESNTAEAFSLLAAARRLTGERPTSLIWGGSTRKRELLASLAHGLSGRHGLFVAVDCRHFEGESYAPERLGQIAQVADGGTLFLNDVEELSGDNCGRVLLLARDGLVELVGAESERVRVNVRVIVGSSRNLSNAVADGLFSTELFELLCGQGPQRTPSVEAFKEAHVLADRLVRERVERCYADSEQRPPEAERVLRAPVGEAVNALVKQFVVMCDAPLSKDVRDGIWDEEMAAAAARFESADHGERIPLESLVARFAAELIREGLRISGGSVTKAAVVLGVTRPTLARWIKENPELQRERTSSKTRGRTS